MGLVLLMFSLMLLAAALLRLAAGARHERAQPRAGRSGRTGTGRAVLRAVRTVNDVRAMGPRPRRLRQAAGAARRVPLTDEVVGSKKDASASPSSPTKAGDASATGR